MNRRQAIKTTFTAAALASVLRPGMLAAQKTPQKPAAVEANTLYLNPATGADTNSGAKDSRLRTLAEAARRVNQTEGTGPLTVILSEGVYAVGETATFKPEGRTRSPRPIASRSALRCCPTTRTGTRAGCRPSSTRCR